jgi:glycosyltransferase involved in cell wall biosynthesis
MGNGVSAQDSLDLLIGIIRKETLKLYGLESIELHLCAPFSVDPDPNINQHGWVTESEARRQIAASDVLFLPYSFAGEDLPVTLASFPAKSADYLASGKAILVLAPRESTIVRYFEQMHCAELVTRLDKDALAQAICRLAAGEEYRRRIASNARLAWDANHNIVRQQERLCEVLRGLVAGKKTSELPYPVP